MEEEVTISKEMIEGCYDFAEAIILNNNQYDRMSPSYAISESQKEKTRIMRTFVGKLGELCFSNYLFRKGIQHDISGMFEIYEGKTNVDEFDFYTENGKSIDVKTAVFKNHSRLVVPLDQFIRLKKDYYVGVKLDINQLENRYDVMKKESIKKAYIWGWCSYTDLAGTPDTNMGEFPCKAIFANELKDINQLLKIM
jgi:hypothetical protein